MTWTDERRERASERMKALHADPEFAAKNRAAQLGVLARLTEAELNDYRTLKYHGYRRSEALRAIGRSDLADEESAA